jgi:hypothetical protein
MDRISHLADNEFSGRVFFRLVGDHLFRIVRKRFEINLIFLFLLAWEGRVDLGDPLKPEGHRFWGLEIGVNSVTP